LVLQDHQDLLDHVVQLVSTVHVVSTVRAAIPVRAALMDQGLLDLLVPQALLALWAQLASPVQEVRKAYRVLQVLQLPLRVLLRQLQTYQEAATSLVMRMLLKLTVRFISGPVHNGLTPVASSGILVQLVSLARQELKASRVISDSQVHQVSLDHKVRRVPRVLKAQSGLPVLLVQQDLLVAKAALVFKVL
jgi:hypothetical protein